MIKKPRHNLSNVQMDSKRGSCSLCGDDVQLYIFVSSIGKVTMRCTLAALANKKPYTFETGVRARELRKKRQSILKSKQWYCRKREGLRHGAKRRAIAMELTGQEIDSIYSQDACYYCKSKLIVRSVDRVDNLKSYNINNCVMSCLECNKLKSAMGYDDMSRMYDILSGMKAHKRNNNNALS